MTEGTGSLGPSVRRVALALIALHWLGVTACERGGGCGHHEHDGPGESAGATPGGHPATDTPTEVTIDPAAIPRVGIVVDVVRAETLFGGVEVPAEVRLDPDRTAHVSPIVQGQVAEVRASIGARVAPGDVLAVLQSVALGETRADLVEARAELTVAEANLRRQTELDEAGIGARRNFVEAQGARERAQARVGGLENRARIYGRGGRGSDTVIRSPIAGEVLERHATVGEVVEPGTTLFVVADLARVWVMGQVFAQDVAVARVGAQARLSLRSVPDREFYGTIDYVAPALDAHTRTLPVRMVLDNTDGVLRPGLFGALRLPGQHDPGQQPVVVAEAVQRLGEREVVFVPGEREGHFQIRPVRVGRREGGLLEILDGLQLGDRFVARGAFVLKSEALREALDHHEH